MHSKQVFLALFFFATLALTTLALKEHRCIHDDIINREKVQKFKVQTTQNYVKPLGDGNAEAGQSWRPIRIFADYRYVQISDPTVRNFLVQQLVPTAINWIQSALSVIPVQGNLVLSKQCYRYYTNPFRCIQYFEPTQCNDAQVPNDHLKEAGGTGVPADLILYVTSVETEGNVLAYATACQFDQKNRPIAGNINFGPQHIDVVPVGSQTFNAQVSTAVHEIFHVLGFSPNSFSKFLDPNGNPWPSVQQSFSERGETVNKITTPTVLKAASQYYNCPNINGLELENKGGAGSVGSHWKKRLVANEFMASVHSNQEYPVYSALTLALMEDSGWYKSNYSAATPLAWGKARGCDFVYNKCINSGQTNYPDHWCTSSQKLSCTLDRRARAQCDLARYTSALPPANRYFTDPSQGGRSEAMDFCPAWTAFSRQEGGDSVCTEASNQPATNYWGEGYGAGSRCFQSTVVDQKFTRFFVNQGATCHTFTCSGGLKVKVGTQWVDCSTPGVKKVPGFNGDFTCPPASTVC